MSKEDVEKIKVLNEARETAHQKMPLAGSGSALYHSIVEIKYHIMLHLLLQEMLEKKISTSRDSSRSKTE